MTGFGDVNIASKFRDEMEHLVAAVIKRERPDVRIGKVFEFDRANQLAWILFAGETRDSLVKVSTGMNMLPTQAMIETFDTDGYDAEANVVRVAGKPGNYYVLDYVYGTPLGPPAAGSEPAIVPGTVVQYWRGDKTWQTLNPAAVGAADDSLVVHKAGVETLTGTKTFSGGDGTGVSTAGASAVIETVKPSLKFNHTGVGAGLLRLNGFGQFEFLTDTATLFRDLKAAAIYDGGVRVFSDNFKPAFTSVTGIAASTQIPAGECTCKVVATSNVTLSGSQTIDGNATNLNDRVLCVGQTNQAENGPWVVQDGAWTRPTDFDSSLDAVGAAVAIMYGTLYGGSVWEIVGWQLNGTALGTTPQVWRQRTSYQGSSDIVQNIYLTGANFTCTSATDVLVTGMTATVQASGPSQLFTVVIKSYFSVGAGYTLVGNLFVDGVSLGTTQGSMVVAMPAAGGGANTDEGTWTVTGLTAGTHTFDFRVRNGAAGQTNVVAGGYNTKMRIFTQAAGTVVAAGFRGTGLQALTNNTLTTVALGATDHNTGGGFSIASNLVTVVDAGVYEVSASLTMDAVGTAGRRLALIEYFTGADPGVGSATQITREEITAQAASYSSFSLTDQVQLPAGAKIRLVAYQVSGGSMNINNIPVAHLNINAVSVVVPQADTQGWLRPGDIGGPTYGVAWADYDATGTNAEVTVVKRVGRTVYVRGIAKRTSGASGNMLTLPAGWGPTRLTARPACYNEVGNTIYITTAGVLQLSGTGAYTNGQSLAFEFQYDQDQP